MTRAQIKLRWRRLWHGECDEKIARAAELDAEIQAIDRRYVIARVNHAPTKTLARMVSLRNALAQQQGQAWGTKKVSL